MLDPEAEERLVEQIRACLAGDADDVADDGEVIALSEWESEAAARRAGCFCDAAGRGLALDEGGWGCGSFRWAK